MDDKILYGAIGGLLSLICVLIAYIWKEARKQNVTKETALQASIQHLEESFRTSITELNTTIMSLRTIIFEEIEHIKKDHNVTKVTVAEIKTLCGERSKHCPLYSNIEQKEGDKKNG